MAKKSMKRGSGKMGGGKAMPMKRMATPGKMPMAGRKMPAMSGYGKKRGR